MSAETSIEWTDATWNPITGCTKVSPGCAHCYAETVALRFWPQQYVHTTTRGFISVKDYDADPMDGQLRAFTDVLTHADRLDHPLRWRRPRRVFVNSMSDLFHEDVPDAFIDQVIGVMASAEIHTFQILTKRPVRMLSYLRRLDEIVRKECGEMPVSFWHGIERRGWPLPNVWLGVSVENQHFADERIPLLLQTPAAVRFISAEPLLGPVKLHDSMFRCCRSEKCDESVFGLDWVIVGGESGPSARPMDITWARSIISQCKAAGVPVFCKQLGAKPIQVLNQVERHDVLLRDKKGGDMSEWPEDLRVRQFPPRRQEGPPTA